MLRIGWAVFSVAGLAFTAGLWTTAWVIDTTRWNGNSCFSLGYAHGNAWVISAVAYPDGFLMVQRFAQNLTLRRGLWAKMSWANVDHQWTFRSVWPTAIRSRPRVASGVTFHMGLPIALFAMMSAHAVGWPLLRRRLRRRRGLCVKCGYDLRGSSTAVCSECGHANVFSGRRTSSKLGRASPVDTLQVASKDSRSSE